MKIENIGFIALIIGIAVLVLYSQTNIDWLAYLGVVILIVGALMINYKRIVGNV